MESCSYRAARNLQSKLATLNMNCAKILNLPDNDADRWVTLKYMPIDQDDHVEDVTVKQSVSGHPWDQA